MIARRILVALAMSVPFVGIAAQALPLEEEMHRVQIACDQGDKKACVRLGIYIGEHRERSKEWHRTHPEYFWWEH
jgi:hypothetical protein